MLRGAKWGAAVMAIAMAVAVVPAATASATVAKSSFCKAYSAELTKQSKSEKSLDKAYASGNWPKIQKALLSSFSTEASEEKSFDAAYLNGASSKVKAAASVALKLDSSFKSIIQTSKSLTQFSSGITAAESTPKVTAALKVLDAYSNKLCPSLTTTTTT